MRAVLKWLEAASTRRPAWVLAALAAISAGMVLLASGLEVQVDVTEFGSKDSAAVQAMDRVRHEFGDPTAAVQVILDAGPGGNILTVQGFAALHTAADIGLDALGPDARTDEDGQPLMLSLGPAVVGELAQDGLELETVGDAQLGSLVARVVAANPQLAGLVSDDFDLAAGGARATVIVLPLDADLNEPQRTSAGEAVQAAFADEQEAGAGVRVTVFSAGLFVSGLLDAIRAEAPRLFGLALLVVLAILALAYRSVFDVAVGFAGLLATVVWTFGFASLLGPGYLGWIGPLSQLAVIVPVLLVGLGIDYSVHLTARYREQRAAGHPPSVAVGTTLRTVGAALVLATFATAVGFASIATAPLGMLADFGVVVAVGVVCAFVVLTLLVPAARVLRDRGGTDGANTVRELRLAGLMRGPVWLAQRRPAAGLVAAAVLVGAALLAATGLTVEFDRDDFIPEGSDVEARLAHQAELFGGGVTESTFVLVDGDLTNPAVVRALREAQHRVGDIDGVRAVGDTPQVLSVVSLAHAALGDQLPRDVDLAAVYARLRDALGRQRVAQFLAPDNRAAVVQIRTTVGDAGAERVQREVEAAFTTLERAGASVTVTSEPIIVAEMSDELSAFQLRSIGLTLALVLVLLVAYYGFARRWGLLGFAAMIPAVVSASLILGTMWLLGISFNVLTATLTAIAIGIGVPYGVHVVNRLAESLEEAPVHEAVARTLHVTGAALTGSALTTLGAFVVLSFSGLPPIRSLGLLGGTGIAFALLAAVLVAPGAFVLLARRRRVASASGNRGA